MEFSQILAQAVPALRLRPGEETLTLKSLSVERGIKLTFRHGPYPNLSCPLWAQLSPGHKEVMVMVAATLAPTWSTWQWWKHQLQPKAHASGSSLCLMPHARAEAATAMCPVLQW